MAGSGPCQARLRRLFRPHRAHRRRSSVVEYVIGNDGVSSSILLGGTIFQSFRHFGGSWKFGCQLSLPVLQRHDNEPPNRFLAAWPIVLLPPPFVQLPARGQPQRHSNVPSLIGCERFSLPLRTLFVCGSPAHPVLPLPLIFPFPLNGKSLTLSPSFSLPPLIASATNRRMASGLDGESACSRLHLSICRSKARRHLTVTCRPVSLRRLYLRGGGETKASRRIRNLIAPPSGQRHRRSNAC